MRTATAGRVTFSSASTRRRAHGWRHAFAPARLVPFGASLVTVAVAMALVYSASVARLGGAGATTPRVVPIDLNSVRTAAELGPALAAEFDAEAERAFVADRILAALPARGQKRLDNVGALATIRVPAAPLLGRAELASFQPRAQAAVARAGAAGAPGAILPLLTPDQVRDLKPRFVVRPAAAFHGAFWTAVLVFFAAALLMHVAAHAGGRLGDPLLLPPALLLCGIGFVALVSLRDPLRDQLLFVRAVQGFGLGAVAFAAASNFDVAASGLRRLSLLPLAGALSLSAALIVFGRGPSGSDARVNLFGVQPIELIRLLLVLFLAGWFAARWQLLRELHEPELGRASGFRLPRREHALPVVVGVALAVAFFFLQRDLGPALVLLALFLVLYAVSRAGVAFALAGLAGIGAAFVFASIVHFPSTVALRTAMWLSPWENGLARGDQIGQALWGFAAGGIFGTGPGLGMPALVPAAHTDLVLATVGEELGLAGVLTCLGLFGLIVARGFRAARRARDPYTLFLALGLTLGFALQTLLIAAGTLGLAPLSGVGVPFVSYGRSGLILDFLALGLLASLSAPAPGEAAPAPDPALATAFDAPLRRLGLVLAVLATAVAVRAVWVQAVRADATLGRGQLARQADGELREVHDPRLLAMAARLPRGDILDRNGVLLATSRWSALQSRRAEYQQLGVDLDRACAPGDARHYPFGGATYHALGDLVSRTNWGASNTAFLERGADDALSGYDDHAHAVTIRDPQDGKQRRIVRRDLSELVPLWRHRWDPGNRDVVALMTRPRDVRSTLDVRLQLRVSHLLAARLAEFGLARGAVVVLDAGTGEVLASASWPQPEGAIRGSGPRLPASAPTSAGADQGPLFDRAVFGLYPPGSTFKLVTAAAALESDPAIASVTFPCRELPDHRAGAIVTGRVIRDDPTDEPHGDVDLEKGMIVSCNAYFAQLGRRIGWDPIDRMAGKFDIDMGDPTPRERPAHLLEASYGQAHVVASPWRMARVAATIADGGVVPPVRWTMMPADSGAPARAMSDATAGTIGRLMRGVVERGTATRLAGVEPPIAGKTGTAQVAGKPSHSWFVGYAPEAAAPHRIAFAVLVENGGYGGVRAATIAGDVVAAARELGLAGEGPK